MKNKTKIQIKIVNLGITSDVQVFQDAKSKSPKKMIASSEISHKFISAWILFYINKYKS